MSDATSTTTISWQVYDQLLTFLPDEGQRDPLPDREFRHLCAAAIKDAEASVSEQDLWESVTVPYVHSISTNSPTPDARASYVTGTPSEYESDELRTIVQILLVEGMVAADAQLEWGNGQP